MAQAKQVEPKRNYVKILVSEHLWREFRIILIRSGRNVTDGIEEAITKWLAIEGKSL